MSSLSVQFSFPPVPLSITNSDFSTSNALDASNPFNFLQFIKIVTVSYEPNVLQDYYQHYLNKWNTQINGKDIDNSNIILERYTDFLKDISLSFTTSHEKRFLSQLDFSDPFDLDIAISFYSKKLRDIVNYYNKLRKEAKYELTRKKLQGSNLGAEKKITELISDILDGYDNSVKDFNAQDIKSRIKVEIAELYNDYIEYFNSTPDYSFYDKKDLGFEEYGNVFLLNFPELEKTLFTTASTELKELLEVSDLVENKFALSQKSVNSDFYYITLSSNDTSYTLLSGKLFEATNSALNTLNQNFPTIASTFRGNLSTGFDIGYFKPNKFSIVVVNNLTNTYTVNQTVIDSLVEPNTVKHFYFPDPNIFGNNLDILTFVLEDTQNKHNISCGLAQNQPSTKTSPVFGYASLPNRSDKLENDLTQLFDQGYIHDRKDDIFGNTYGLIKDGNNFRNNIRIVEQPIIKSMVFDGHTFYDELYDEEFNYDYDTYDTTTFRETIRSGLSSYTNSFTSNPSSYWINFRSFSPYEDLTEPTENKEQFAIHDCAYFMLDDNEFLTDSISTDDTAYNGTGQFYYSTVLSGSPGFSSAWSSRENCGLFSTEYDLNISIDIEQPVFDDTVYSTTEFDTINSQIESLYTRNIKDGSMYIRNGYTGKVATLADALPEWESRFGSNAFNQLNNGVRSFDIVYDTIFAETSGYFVIDKVSFSEGVYSTPNTTNVILTINNDNFDKVSSRFKVKDDVYFFIVRKLYNSLSATNNFICYPEIYKYNYSAGNELIFPKNQSQVLALSSRFSIQGGDVKYVKSSSPRITYNQTNDIFNASWLLKDLNELPYVISHDFEYTSFVNFISSNSYTLSNENITLDNLNLFTVELSSGSITQSGIEFRI